MTAWRLGTGLGAMDCPGMPGLWLRVVFHVPRVRIGLPILAGPRRLFRGRRFPLLAGLRLMGMELARR